MTLFNSAFLFMSFPLLNQKPLLCPPRPTPISLWWLLQTSSFHFLPTLGPWGLHKNKNQNKPLKPIIYIRVYSWCCTFYGFWQMYNYIYPPLKYHTNSFTALKILSASPMHPSLPFNLWQTLIFYHLRSFAFSRMSYIWNHTICSLFRLASFT